MSDTKRTLTLTQMILFSLGQFGWSLATFSVANVLVYFYMPPKTLNGDTLFPTTIPQITVLGSFTLLGLLSFGSRFVDAIKDPLIANWSDKSRSRFGKRRLFLALGCGPAALLSWLVFSPPLPGASWGNVWWLGICLVAFYIALTMYVVPYNALVPELTDSPEERLQLSTLISVTWALGFALGNQIYSFQNMVQERWSLDPTSAFRNVIACFGALSFLLMLVPVLTIRERPLQTSQESFGLFRSIQLTFQNRNFRYFALSDLLYWLSLTFIQLGMGYYVVVLLNLAPSHTSFLMMILFVLSFVFYIPIQLLTRTFGKKRLVQVAFVLFALTFGFCSQLGKLPFSPETQGYLVAMMAAVPIAIFGILPTAILADLAEPGRVGMLYAVRNVTMKFGISIANLIFPSLLLLGRGGGEDLGVRVTAIVAFVFCLAGLLLFSKFRESQSPGIQRS